MSASAPKIVVIGGGTGSFTILQNLKNLTPNITAIVNMSDDGGSTGKLRDELGVLPPGDIRQCLVALSNIPEVRDLFDYRFGQGSLAGHSLGNVILSGLEMRYEGDFEQAISVASLMLNITGAVVPVTLQKHKLLLQDGDKLIEGQWKIEASKIIHVDARILFQPTVQLNPRAAAAIMQADLLVVAPGNLYCSLLPTLATEGMAEAFATTAAKKVVIANLVNKPLHTPGWHVVDYVKKIEEYVGQKSIDFVLYNSTPPAAELLAKYAKENELPLETASERFREIAAQPLAAPLVSPDIYVQDANDKQIPRTLIRHDAEQVSRELMRLLP